MKGTGLASLLAGEWAFERLGIVYLAGTRVSVILRVKTLAQRDV